MLLRDVDCRDCDWFDWKCPWGWNALPKRVIIRRILKYPIRRLSLESKLERSMLEEVHEGFVRICGTRERIPTGVDKSILALIIDKSRLRRYSEQKINKKGSLSNSTCEDSFANYVCLFLWWKASYVKQSCLRLSARCPRFSNCL